MNNNNVYDLISLLNKKEIKVPIIQRDYAQGRVGKEYIRKKFLREIADCLSSAEDTELMLDFVYGYENNGVFYPLDGQQRLTTLWLVLWYLAVRSGSAATMKILKKFSYETRTSSKDFCKALCEKMLEYSNKKGIVDYIKNQSWFFNAWKKDPTINAMLRMLSGTKKEDGTPNEDGIEQIIGRHKKGTFENYLIRFIRICFCIKVIGGEELPLKAADRLYVKMNARGKPLSDFENFKADFVDWMQNADGFQQQDVQHFSAQLDSTWNDVFWELVDAGSTDGKTDEVFYAFIIRYCANRLLVMKNGNEYCLNKSEANKRESSHRPGDNSPDYTGLHISLYPPKGEDDWKISYESFDNYRPFFTLEAVTALDKMLSRIKGYTTGIATVLKALKLPDGDKKSSNVMNAAEHCYFPYYTGSTEDRDITYSRSGLRIKPVSNITNKGRLYFFAICRYLEQGEFKEDSFAEWMRVVRNLVENSGIDSVTETIECMRTLDEWSGNAHSILTHLRDQPAINGNLSKLGIQINEEISKAKKILGDNGNSWIDAIREAENSKFFYGAIRFLFHGGDGENWDDFQTKYSYVKNNFGDNKVPYEFVKQYALSFGNFRAVNDIMIFHDIGYQNRGDSWKDILCNPAEYARTNKVLMFMKDHPQGQTKEQPQEQSQEQAQDNEISYQNFVQSAFFKALVTCRNRSRDNRKDLRIITDSDGIKLYKKHAPDGLIFDSDTFHRGRTLEKLERENKIVVLGKWLAVEKQEIYYWGYDITFEYEDKKFTWTKDNHLYLLDGNKIKTDAVEEIKNDINADGIIDLCNKLRRVESPVGAEA